MSLLDAAAQTVFWGKCSAPAVLSLHLTVKVKMGHIYACPYAANISHCYGLVTLDLQQKVHDISKIPYCWMALIQIQMQLFGWISSDYNE